MPKKQEREYRRIQVRDSLKKTKQNKINKNKTKQQTKECTKCK